MQSNGPDSEREDNTDSPVSPAPPYLTKTSSSERISSDDLAGPFSEREEFPPKPLGRDHAGSSDPPEIPARRPQSATAALSHNTLIRWIETPAERRLSSDAGSGKSSDQDRNDLSAGESDERTSGREGAESPDVVLPTTYFSVDNCMTATYRAKYHKRPALNMRAEDHTSSGESDVDARRLPADRPQPGYSASTKPVAKWNPVTPKGLDEHGFL